MGKVTPMRKMKVKVARTRIKLIFICLTKMQIKVSSKINVAN